MVRPDDPLKNPEGLGTYELSSAQCASLIELFSDYQTWCDQHKSRPSMEDMRYWRWNEGLFPTKEALRQSMDDPAYIGIAGDSPKHVAMDRIINKEIGLGHKIMIFCRYRSEVAAYVRRYQEQGARAYDGSIPRDSSGHKIDNQGRIEYYQTDSLGAFKLLNGAPPPSDEHQGKPIDALDYQRLCIENCPSNRILVCTYDTGSDGQNFPAIDAVIYDDLASAYREHDAGLKTVSSLYSCLII
ncbi:MAG: hypothetical protein NTU66_04825 [Elusimicrobia bacterium]|nr:hypothetical protein [Elusimicrobiota bacterium]